MTLVPLPEPAKPERVWYVMRTSFGAEDKAARALRRAGFRVYVPRMRRSVFNRRQRKLVIRRYMLFNRYIFAGPRHGRRIDWTAIDRRNGIDAVLGINGHWRHIPDAVVARFLMAQRRRAFDDVRGAALSGRQKRAAAEKQFRKDAHVRVLAGPFGGFSGHVTTITGRGAVRAMLDIFGRLTPVDFEPEQLAAIDAASEAA